MSQSNSKTNEPMAKAAMSAEARKKKLANLAAKFKTLNERAKDFLLHTIDPDSDIAHYIVGLDNPNAKQLAKIIAYYLCENKTSIRNKAKKENGTSAMGRLGSAIEAGLFDVSDDGRVLSTTKAKHQLYVDIRNETDGTNHTVSSHNRMLFNTGFLRKHDVDKGVVAWTYKDESLDLSDSSVFAKISTTDGHGRSVYEKKGKGQGKQTPYSEAELLKLAIFLRDNPEVQMNNISDERANAICQGRNALSLRTVCRKWWGSVVPSKASMHPNFNLALEGKEMVPPKNGSRTNKLTESELEMKLPAKENIDPEEEKEDAADVLELTESELEMKPKSSANTKKRNSSSSNTPANSRKSSANTKKRNFSHMHNNASEDEKDPYVPSDYESDDDEL